ncbi:hypothetical protein [uncultured Pontibacter sp.]|uniref:hypothetical protein n=1 Tax=uncultured Pontibacter sp. TaxID=453356 RepID=UPI002633CEBE|nr:hypothetical protein [uncultured Pontibacter sp.]
MKNRKVISILVVLLVVAAAVATTTGIMSEEGPGPFQHETVRGKTVTIYGKGVYQHMSAEVAPQGIAQDYVTLLLGIPLLIIALLAARTGSLIARFLLAGTLGYFLVTYLFYLLMGMYNVLFLVYVFLLATSFFAFILTLLSFDRRLLPSSFLSSTPHRLTGGFLIFQAVAIALLWLSIVVPPLLDRSIIPVQVEHYTTLVVQGLDLGLLLPAGFVAGILFFKKKPFGYLFAPVYFVFLSLLMTALTAKVIAMALLGYQVIPAIFIIPVFNILSILSGVLILKNIGEKGNYGQTESSSS